MFVNRILIVILIFPLEICFADIVRVFKILSFCVVIIVLVLLARFCRVADNLTLDGRLSDHHLHNKTNHGIMRKCPLWGSLRQIQLR